MDLDQAITLVKKTVKHTGVINQKHIDLQLVSGEQRELYGQAMAVIALSIKDGKITKDEFSKRVNLD